MPMIMVVSFVYYVAMLTRSIVYEKEQRLKEVCATCYLSFVQCLLTIFSSVERFMSEQNQGEWKRLEKAMR